MSKRNRVRRASETASPAAPIPGPDLLRRSILVLVTMLLVLGPLLGGEFPGLQSDFADSGCLILTFLALLGCTAWSAWRLRSREAAVYVGPVEMALFVLVVILFVATAASASFRPASLLAWQWLGLGLVVFLVRQLAARPDERHGLIVVLLATGVSLAGEGALQTVFLLPREKEALHAETTLLPPTRAVKEGIDPHVDALLRARGSQATALEAKQLSSRLENKQAHGPFFHSSSLAAVLALVLPMLVGAVVASRRGGGPRWQTVAVALCAVLVALTLYFTGDQTALLVVGLVLLVLAGLFVWPARLGGWKLGLPLALAGGIALCSSGLAVSTWQRLREVWPAAWRLVENHFWRGVGPGQFGNFYPRYLDETASAKVVDPSSLLLELSADGGVWAVLAFLGVGYLFVRAVVRWWREKDTRVAPPESEASKQEATPAVVRWEYYVGGMLGLILGFVLRAGYLHIDEVINETIAVGVRSVIWFAACGLFEGLSWSLEEYVGALTAGLASFFGLLLVHAGIDHVNVTCLAWVAVALVLATVEPAPPDWLGRLPVVNMAPLPIFLAGAFAYFTFVYYPAANSDTVIREVRQRRSDFFNDLARDPKERILGDPSGFILQRIIRPLERARKEDATNTELLVLLSEWQLQLWALAPQAPAEAMRNDPVSLSREVQRLNPEAGQGYRKEAEVRSQIAQVLNEAARRLEQRKPKEKVSPQEQDALRKQMTQLRRDAREQLERVVEVLRKYLPRDPRDPALRQQLAANLYELGRSKEGEEQGIQARRLDEQAGPLRKLTEPQREQLERMLGKENPR